MNEIDISRIKDDLDDIQAYLTEHDVGASYLQILEASLTLAKRMGAGNWSFVCELKHRKKREEEE